MRHLSPSDSNFQGEDDGKEDCVDEPEEEVDDEIVADAFVTDVVVMLEEHEEHLNDNGF